MKKSKPHILITGLPADGKSTLINRLLSYAERKVYGVRSLPALDSRGQIIGYDLLDVESIEKRPLARSKGNIPPLPGGKNLTVSQDAFSDFALPQLRLAWEKATADPHNSLLLLDEIGRFEKSEQVYLALVAQLLEQETVPLLAVFKREDLPFNQRYLEDERFLRIDLHTCRTEEAWNLARQKIHSWPATDIVSPNDSATTYFRLVIMAAGRSVRFGTDKRFIPWRGQPLFLEIFHQIAQLVPNKEFTYTPLLVSNHDIIKRLAAGYGFIPLHNPRPELGQSESLRIAVNFNPLWRHQAEKREFAVFLTIDQPYLRSADLQYFLSTIAAGEHGLWRSQAGERFGSPTAFHQKYYEELRELQGDVGGKAILLRHPADCAAVEMPELALRDIDTVTDYHQLINLD